MSYDSSQDWQMQSPGWREQQIFKCLCTLKDNLASYFEGGGGSQPLIYRALITQQGTDDPTAIVLENTTGETLTFSYSGVGQYSIGCVNPIFTPNKTYISHNGVIDVSSTPYIMSTIAVSDSIVSIETGAPSELGGGDLGVFALTDGLLNNTELTIYIYP